MIKTKCAVTQQPNILICMCDQLRAFEVGCYGNEVIQMPNIDRLTAEGMPFQAAVSPYPVCMAARPALLSGQYSRTCTGGVSMPYMERLCPPQAAGTVRPCVEGQPVVISVNYKLAPQRRLDLCFAEQVRDDPCGLVRPVHAQLVDPSVLVRIDHAPIRTVRPATAWLDS